MLMEDNKSGHDASRGSQAMIFGLLFEKILKNMNAVSMATGETGRINFTSHKFLEFFEYKPKDILGKDWIKTLIPEDKRKPVKDLFDSMKEEEKLSQFNVPVVTSKGFTKGFIWTVAPLASHGDGKQYLFVGAGPGKTGECGPSGCLVDGPEVKKVREEIAHLLFEASEKCDPETAKHALRSMFFAERLAREAGLSAKKIENLKTASLLHDLGKLAVDPGVLFKKGKLTQEEFEHVKKHLVWGADLLGRMNFFKDVVEIMCNHHENYDGRGYPNGTSGEAIPLEARILSVADIYEALTADRPYREAFSFEEAMAIMEYEKGHKLDPRLTDIFLKLVKRENLER